jgi:hypothetical protein
VHDGGDRLQLFDDEPPASRRLQRDFELLTGEAAEELTDAIAVRVRGRGITFQRRENASFAHSALADDFAECSDAVAYEFPARAA